MLVFRARAERSKLFLQIPDFQHEVCTLPIGRVRNDTLEESERHAREDAEGESATIIVPVLALAYTTPEPDKDQAAHLDQGDRLYVFIDGHLWRELEVADTGFLQDVNLEYVAGRDGADRPATGVGLKRLELPYRVDYYEPEIRIAVSKTPWSWARINSLGGMQDGDFRLEQAGKNGWADLIPPTPEQRDGARERLEQRTQCIDLGDYPSGFTNATTASPCADAEGPQDRAARPVRAVSTRRLDEVAGVIYLHDPIRVAIALTRKVEEEQAAFDALLGEIEQHEHYRSALVARQVFFSDRLHARQTERQRTGMLTWDERRVYDKQSERAETLRDIASRMDKSKITEDVLQTDERAAHRRRIRAAIGELAAYLAGHFVSDDNTKGEAIQSALPNALTFATALRDFAYGKGQDYLDLWRVLLLVIRRLNHDPLDTDIDTSEADAERDQARPGQWYMEALLQADHPLYPILFPATDQVDPHQADYTPSADPPEALADGRFRPTDFSEAMRVAPKDKDAIGIEDVFNVSEKLFGAIVALFHRQIGEGPQQNQLSYKQTVMRLFKATNQVYARDFFLTNPNQDASNIRVIDGGHLVPAQEHSGYASDQWRPSDHRSGHYGVPYRDVERPDPRELFVDARTERMRRAYVAVYDESPTARQLADPDFARETRNQLTMEGFEAAKRGIAPVIAVFAFWNLFGATYSLFTGEQRSTARRGVGFAHALLSAGAASLDASMALYGTGAPERAGRRVAGRKGQKVGYFVSQREFQITKSIKVRFLTLANTGLAFGGAAMAIWDSLHHLDRADRDAALAYAVQSGFFVALGVATIGEAVFASSTLIFFGLGPFGWAFLIAIALTGWLASTLVDSPLERWAGFGPFAAENPMSQEYEGLDGESVFEQLRELLMRPSIRLTTEQGQFIEHEGQKVRFVEVRCEVPSFEPGHSQLQIEVTEQDWQELRIDRVTKPRQELVDPVEYKPLYSEETGGIIGVRRRYPADPRYIYRARMRHHLPGDVIIPSPPAERGLDIADSEDNGGDRGWVVARAIKRIG